MNTPRKIKYRALHRQGDVWYYGTSEINSAAGRTDEQVSGHVYDLLSFWSFVRRGFCDGTTVGEWAGETVQKMNREPVDEYEGDVIDSVNEDGDGVISVIEHDTGDEERFACGLVYRVVSIYAVETDEAGNFPDGWNGAPRLLGNIHQHPDLAKQPSQ